MERRGFLSRILGIAVAGAVVGKVPPKVAVVTGHDPFDDYYDPKGFGVIPAKVEGIVKFTNNPLEYRLSPNMLVDQKHLNRIMNIVLDSRFATTEWGK